MTRLSIHMAREVLKVYSFESSKKAFKRVSFEPCCKFPIKYIGLRMRQAVKKFSLKSKISVCSKLLT